MDDDAREQLVMFVAGYPGACLARLHGCVVALAEDVEEAFRAGA